MGSTLARLPRLPPCWLPSSEDEAGRGEQALGQGEAGSSRQASQGLLTSVANAARAAPSKDSA